MALLTFTRMAVAYGNMVNPAAVTGVGTSGIGSFFTGFTAANLEYEDPWMLMKTASISGQPIIEHTFGSSVAPQVLGILNHNLGSAGYTPLAVERWNGSGWDAMADIGIQSSGDSDLWIAWTAAAASTRWRFKLDTAARGNFYIGSVFYGSIFNSDTNPLISNQSRETPLVIETASGGARYATFGADVRMATAEITYQRTTHGEVDFYRAIPKYALLGFMTPEHGDAVTVMRGQEVLWGYVVRRTMTPRGPGGISTGQPGRYDMTIEIQGAV